MTTCHRKTSVLFCLSLLSLTTGCHLVAGPHIKGSGIAVSEARDLPSFDRVRVSGAIDAKIICGEAQTVTILGDDNIVPLLKTLVSDDGLLSIYMEPGSYSHETEFELQITTPDLAQMNVSGACDVSVEAIDHPQFRASVSGASKLSLEGQSEQFKVSVSGASRVDSTNFATGIVDAHVSDASTVRVYAIEKVTGEVSGASNLIYSGEPTSVNVEATGASSCKAG